MTDATTTESMSETESEQGEAGVEQPDINADEPAKIRIHGSNDDVEFDIGSSFSEDEILYLKFTDQEELRKLRDFAADHLNKIDWNEVDDAG